MKKAEILYTLLLMLFVLTLLFISTEYDWKSALFPLLVCVFTLVLGLLTLAMDFYPRLSRFAETDVFSPAGSDNNKKTGKGTAGEISAKDFLWTSFWMVLIIMLVFSFGFLISLPVWILGYVHFKGKRPWKFAFMTAAIMFVFMYGFFVRIMGVELFQGIVFGGFT